MIPTHLLPRIEKSLFRKNGDIVEYSRMNRLNPSQREGFRVQRSVTPKRKE
jgi:hypothetical protein